MNAANIGRRLAPLRMASWNVTTGALGLLGRLRGRHLFVIDGLLMVAAAWLALSVRLEATLSPSAAIVYLPAALVPVVVRLALGIRMGLYRRLWIHASVPDLTQILWAASTGTLASLAIVYIVLSPFGLAGTAALPRSFWLVEMLFSLAAIGGIRFAIRAVNDIATTVVVSGSKVSLSRALLYGAGREGALIARSAKRDPRAGVLPVGFLDADVTRRGTTIGGLPVFGGLDMLTEAVHRTGASMLLITMPNAAGTAIRTVMTAAQEAGLEVRRIPGVHELLDGSIEASRIRKVRVEDLLTREQVTTHAPGAADAIRDQVVMVTGAGGSIGSELARQIHSFRPRKLILVDRAESPLYLIERELELRALAGKGGGELATHIANVVSRDIMRRIVTDHQPSVIFHAAACKHVPMMEEHPSEAVQVNIGGTLSVLDAAAEAGVPRFVLVSTDKAVEPSSVMGATKRLAEWLVADVAAKTGLAYVSVRFGNVLGSAGSVLPIFQQQLEQGDALTVTHEDMTRYFMTIQEACWLILDAAAIGGAGDLFVLDMGEPVRIMDMARDLIRLSGRDPAEVPIRITGLRAGEKLNESLFYESETIIPTGVNKIMRVIDSPPPTDAASRARRLVSLARGTHDPALRAALFRAIDPRRLQAVPAPDSATADAKVGVGAIGAG